MACNREVALVTNGTITATGSGSAVLANIGQKAVIMGWAKVGTVTGTTPSMTVDFQHSPDGTNWKTAFTATAITTSNQVEWKRDTAYGLGYFNYWRANYTVTGTTPNFATVNISIYVED